MKDTHITEIMSREELNILNIRDRLDSLNPIRDCGGSYIVDDENILKGRIDKRRILEFLGPSLMIIDGANRGAFMNRVSSLAMDDVMEYHPETCPLDCSFAEILKRIESSDQEALPVTDSEGKLIGEVSCRSILNYLECNTDSFKKSEAEVLKAV